MKLSYFFTYGKWKKIHYVFCICTSYSFQETVISAKNHQKWVFFKFLELLKIHISSFKNSLKLIFHQNISKTIQKIQIWTNIQKLPSPPSTNVHCTVECQTYNISRAHVWSKEMRCWSVTAAHSSALNLCAWSSMCFTLNSVASYNSPCYPLQSETSI